MRRRKDFAMVLNKGKKGMERRQKKARKSYIE
jgi:hypothetical protein